jgi:beta-glucanase (GH16 family)
MKLPHAPTSIMGFFLEIYNDSSRRIMFTTYSGGRQTHTVTKQLPFDPTADYHTYAFRYGEGLARFVVDGNVMQT